MKGSCPLQFLNANRISNHFVDVGNCYKQMFRIPKRLLCNIRGKMVDSSLRFTLNLFKHKSVDEDGEKLVVGVVESEGYVLQELLSAMRILPDVAS